LINAQEPGRRPGSCEEEKNESLLGAFRVALLPQPADTGRQVASV